jgi:hypothetical protein
MMLLLYLSEEFEFSGKDDEKIIRRANLFCEKIIHMKKC